MRLTLGSKTPGAHDDALWAVVWNQMNGSVLTGSVDETVKCWQQDSADRGVLDHQQTWTGHTLGVIALDVDALGSAACSSALDSFIRVWNLENDSTIAVIETAPSETWQVCFHPSQEKMLIVAAGGSSNRVVVHDTADSQVTQQFALPESKDSKQKDGCAPQHGHQPRRQGKDSKKKDGFALSVAISPDGRLLACGGSNGGVSLFDVATGKYLATLEGHYKPVRSLTFTPDSRRLLTACDDMHSHLYDVSSHSIGSAYSGHQSWVLSVACHPDGDAFATASSDSKVMLWDLRSQACAQTLSEHTDQVWGVAFDKTGQRLASVSDDKSLVIYTYSQ